MTSYPPKSVLTFATDAGQENGIYTYTLLRRWMLRNSERSLAWVPNPIYEVCTTIPEVTIPPPPPTGKEDDETLAPLEAMYVVTRETERTRSTMRTVWATPENETRLLLASLYLDSQGRLCVTCYGSNPAAAENLLEYVRKNTERKTAQGADTVRVGFNVDSTGNHPDVSVREVRLVPWSGIEHNYAVRTRESLVRLARLREPSSGGRILLLHGAPGTGKSYAIRSLMREWKPWAAFLYCLDPEALFRDGTYLQKAIHSGVDDMLDLDDDYAEEDLTNDPSNPHPGEAYFVTGKKHRPQWCVIVLEDAGTFIARDSNQCSGLGFSRLINTADGIIGDGYKVLFLITTNERMHLHDAIARPGRCLADIRFDLLSRAEAAAWCDLNELDSGVLSKAPPGPGIALAWLYEKLGGEQIVTEGRPTEVV